MSTRSNQQTWNVDCANKRMRVVSMRIFALSNLQGQHMDADMPSATWSPPRSGSPNERIMDRICRAPTEGKRLQ
jgi:hypothetical protein